MLSSFICESVLRGLLSVLNRKNLYWPRCGFQLEPDLVLKRTHKGSGCVEVHGTLDASGAAGSRGIVVERDIETVLAAESSPVEDGTAHKSSKQRDQFG